MAGIWDALEKWKEVTTTHAECREKDLEEERMWGFNMGWRLCEEENKVRSAVSIETAAPANIVLDLEDTLPTTTCSVETQTDAPVAAAPPLDWAEDAGDLPVPMFPKSPPPVVARDFPVFEAVFPSLSRAYNDATGTHCKRFPALNQIKIRVFAILHRIHDQQKITRLHLLPACVSCPPSPHARRLCMCQLEKRHLPSIGTVIPGYVI
ncbi:hypothetical protein DFH08DRAFT_968698 [Mycena albidolilacea]|uniref:Uncharacterized protein n=1 Tax=Mycena albidolilacea TaxID=1033008 RepID=A0AAD6ZJE7_9AGAR|nr:hypothetical protein DFH08DRAFT_968698 [Mycena albidolilacea]